MEAGARRVRMAWSGSVAAVVVAAAGVVYLRPSLALPGIPAASAGPVPMQLVGAAFGDADHGIVSVTRGRPPGSPLAYATSDGGHTWRPTASALTYLRDGGLAIDQRASRLTDDGGRTWRHGGVHWTEVHLPVS